MAHSEGGRARPDRKGNHVGFLGLRGAKLLTLATAVACGLTVAVVPVTATSASAATSKAATSTKISISDKTLSYGARPTVTIAVRASKKPVSKVKVELQKRARGASAWHTMKTYTTHTTGRVAVKLPKQWSSTQFRAKFNGTSHYKSSTSAFVTAQVSQHIAITKKSTLSPTAGNKITLKGRTTAPLVGKGLVMQMYASHRWVNVASTRVRKDHSFGIQAKATLAGKRVYRLVAPATAATPRTASSEVKFTVYAWHYLTEDFDSPDSDYMDVGDVSTIGGTKYSHSVVSTWWGATDTWAEFNLNYKCKEFRASIGISDSSTSSAVGKFYAQVDSQSQVTLGTKAPGKATMVYASTVNGYRLRIGAIYEDGSVWSDSGVFGNPQALCSY